MVVGSQAELSEKKNKKKNSTTISIMQNQQLINLICNLKKVTKLTVLCSNVLNIYNIAFQYNAFNLL